MTHHLWHWSCLWFTQGSFRNWSQ